MVQLSRTAALLCASLLLVPSLGLRCRVENEPRSVEEFERLVRTCLRTSSSGGKSKGNKPFWNTGPHSSGKGKIGEESEEDDDYDDDYGQQSNTSNSDGNKYDGTRGGNKTSRGQNNRGGYGIRLKRSAQGYGYWGYQHTDDDRRGSNNNWSQDGTDEVYRAYGTVGYNNRNYRNRDDYGRSGNADFDDRNGYGDRDYKYGRMMPWISGYGFVRDNDNYPRRYKRQSGYGGYGNDRPYGGYDNDRPYGGYGRPYGGYGYDDRRPDRNDVRSSLKSVDPCAIHCILRHKKMVNEDSMPDKAAMVSSMSRSVRRRDLKQFVQESVSGCFDRLESGETEGRCAAAKAIVLCLEEKGRQQCQDWDRP